MLSIVVPVYNEEETISEMVRRLLNLRLTLAEEIEVELLFVDDGSTDSSLSRLRDHAKNERSIKVVSLSRNFGHQIAISAGIDIASGSYVAVIDADLQDPPELIADMYRIALTGVDVVYGLRRSRDGETLFKRTTAAYFYKFMRYMCDIDIPADTGDFRLMSRKVVDAFKQLKERHRFIRGMVPWLGFRSCPLVYDRAERYAGVTKYPFQKMLSFATNAILSFSSKPLAMAIRLGLFAIAAGSVGGAYMLYLKLFTEKPIPGLTAVLMSIVVFSGVQILLIGVVGQYISRIFEEVKGRPLYLVSETINIEK